MRKLFLITLAIFLSMGVFAQGPFTGFFKPGKNLGIEYGLKADGSQREWYFRPAAQLTAVQFIYNKDLKQFESSTFSSAGIGIGYQHFIKDVNDNLVNNYGFNALLVIDASQSSMAGIGIAATFNAMQFINIGGGFNLTNKQFFVLTGAIWTF